MGSASCETELGAEVGDHLVALVAVGRAEPRRRGGIHVFVEGGEDRLVALEKVRAGGGGVQFFLVDRAQQLDRVMADGFPQFGVDRGEERLGLRFPAPPEVERDVVEAFDLGGQLGIDGDLANDVHINGLLLGETCSMKALS